MRKKQKQQHNPEKQTFKDVQYLQKKLGQEKENLVRQNKKLQKQIHEEIQQNRVLKTEFGKIQKTYETKLQQLRMENENLKTQLLLNQDENNNSEQFQIKLKETRDAYKGLSQENQELKQKLSEYTEIIEEMEEDIKQLEKQNSKYKRKIKDDELEIKNLAKEIGNNKQFYKELQQESEKTIQQLQRQIEQNSKLESSLTHMKKKNKEFNAIIKQLQERMELINKKQHEEFQHQLNILRKEKQELQHIRIQKQSQISFLKIAEAQKNQYIDTITKELHEYKNSSQINSKENTVLTANLQKVENQNRRLQIQQQKEKSRISKEIQELKKNHEEEANKIKRKIAEQVTNLFKSGSDNKVIENYIEGLKSHKSQMNLRGGIGLGGKIPEQKLHIPFQKLKYEHQISNLSLQIENLKKNIETSNSEIQNLRKTNDQITKQSENRSLRIKELNLKIDSLQNEKRVSDQQHYKELIRYRNIETEMLENKRNYIELEQATTLKINYYDKKIKEYIDGIDRKDSIIENLRNSKMEAEGKMKFMEEKLVKSLEDVQTLKKFKNDTSRKDQLLKDYKEKLEKHKSELESLKNQIDKIKKEKTRLQRNLESKEQYINTLKARNQKQQQEKQSHLKQQRSIKELKQKYEGRLKKLKKQLEELQQIIEAMRSVIAEKIQQAIKKSISQQEPLQQNWEGAAVLGLKSSQIEQFVNPTVNLDRNICEDLDGLWQSRRYQQFMRSSIQYILLKNQRDLPQLK